MWGPSSPNPGILSPVLVGPPSLLVLPLSRPLLTRLKKEGFSSGWPLDCWSPPPLGFFRSICSPLEGLCGFPHSLRPACPFCFHVLCGLIQPWCLCVGCSLLLNFCPLPPFLIFRGLQGDPLGLSPPRACSSLGGSFCSQNPPFLEFVPPHAVPSNFVPVSHNKRKRGGGEQSGIVGGKTRGL